MMQKLTGMFIATAAFALNVTANPNKHWWYLAHRAGLSCAEAAVQDQSALQYGTGCSTVGFGVKKEEFGLKPDEWKAFLLMQRVQSKGGQTYLISTFGWS